MLLQPVIYVGASADMPNPSYTNNINNNNKTLSSSSSSSNLNQHHRNPNPDPSLLSFHSSSSSPYLNFSSLQTNGISEDFVNNNNGNSNSNSNRPVLLSKKTSSKAMMMMPSMMNNSSSSNNDSNNLINPSSSSSSSPFQDNYHSDHNHSLTPTPTAFEQQLQQQLQHPIRRASSKQLLRKGSYKDARFENLNLSTGKQASKQAS